MSFGKVAKAKDPSISSRQGSLKMLPQSVRIFRGRDDAVILSSELFCCCELLQAIGLCPSVV